MRRERQKSRRTEVEKRTPAPIAPAAVPLSVPRAGGAAGVPSARADRRLPREEPRRREVVKAGADGKVESAASERLERLSGGSTGEAPPPTAKAEGARDVAREAKVSEATKTDATRESKLDMERMPRRASKDAVALATNRRPAPATRLSEHEERKPARPAAAAPPPSESANAPVVSSSGQTISAVGGNGVSADEAPRPMMQPTLATQPAARAVDGRGTPEPQARGANAAPSSFFDVTSPRLAEQARAIEKERLRARRADGLDEGLGLEPPAARPEPFAARCASLSDELVEASKPLTERPSRNVGVIGVGSANARAASAAWGVSCCPPASSSTGGFGSELFSFGGGISSNLQSLPDVSHLLPPTSSAVAPIGRQASKSTNLSPPSASVAAPYNSGAGLFSSPLFATAPVVPSAAPNEQPRGLPPPPQSGRSELWNSFSAAVGGASSSAGTGSALAPPPSFGFGMGDASSSHASVSSPFGFGMGGAAAADEADGARRAPGSADAAATKTVIKPAMR